MLVSACVYSYTCMYVRAWVHSLPLCLSLSFSIYIYTYIVADLRGGPKTKPSFVLPQLSATPGASVHYILQFTVYVVVEGLSTSTATMRGAHTSKYLFTIHVVAEGRSATIATMGGAHRGISLHCLHYLHDI